MQNQSTDDNGIIDLCRLVHCDPGLYAMNVNIAAHNIAETEMVPALVSNKGNDLVSQVFPGGNDQAEDMPYPAIFLRCKKARHIIGKIIKVYGGLYN